MVLLCIFKTKIHKVLTVNIWWKIKCDLCKFSFAWNFHNKIMCWIQSNIFCDSKIRLRDKTKRKKVNFFSLVHNSVTIGLSFSLRSISVIYHQKQLMFRFLCGLYYHHLSWLTFIFFLKDSFRNVKNYLTQK